MLFALGLTGLPGSTTAGPSLPNQAPQASITFLRSASDAGGAPPPLYTSRKFAIHRLLVHLLSGQYARAARDDEPGRAKSTRTKPNRDRLAAHPADKLLDLDPVEPPHDPSTAEPEHGKALTIEIFPLLPGDRVAVDRPVFEGDTRLVGPIRTQRR